MLKDATTGAHFWTEIVNNLENTIQTIIQKPITEKAENDIKTMPKGIQELSVLGFVWERMTFGNCWFYVCQT